MSSPTFLIALGLSVPQGEMEGSQDDLGFMSSVPRPGPVPVRTMNHATSHRTRQTPGQPATRDVTNDPQQPRATIETLRRQDQRQEEVARDLNNANTAMVIEVTQLKANAVQHESDLAQSRSHIQRLRESRDHWKNAHTQLQKETVNKQAHIMLQSTVTALEKSVKEHTASEAALRVQVDNLTTAHADHHHTSSTRPQSVTTIDEHDYLQLQRDNADLESLLQDTVQLEMNLDQSTIYTREVRVKLSNALAANQALEVENEETGRQASEFKKQWEEQKLRNCTLAKAFAQHKRDTSATSSEMRVQVVELRNQITQLQSRLEASESEARFGSQNSVVKAEGSVGGAGLMTAIQAQSVVLTLEQRLRDSQGTHNALEAQLKHRIEELEKREQAAHTVIRAMSNTDPIPASPSQYNSSASSLSSKRAATTYQPEPIKRPRLIDLSADESPLLLPAQDPEARDYSDRTFQCLLPTAEGEQHRSSDVLPKAIVDLVCDQMKKFDEATGKAHGMWRWRKTNSKGTCIYMSVISKKGSTNAWTENKRACNACCRTQRPCLIYLESDVVLLLPLPQALRQTYQPADRKYWVTES